MGAKDRAMSDETHPTIDPEGIVGVLLAGGLARRMGGGDKCLVELGGETLLSRAIQRIQPQLGATIINANGDASRFADYKLPVVADSVEGVAGPLAGVLAGMEWVSQNLPEKRWIVTLPTDAPFFPQDLVHKLSQALVWDRADLACAKSGGRAHPVFGLWPVALKDSLRHKLVEEEVRKVDIFTADYQMAVAEWPVGSLDPFLNINTTDELAAAEQFL